MLSLSHPHPHAAAASAAPRHQRASRSAASCRRRATHIAASAILLPGGGSTGVSGDRKLPFTPPPTAPPGQLYQPFHPPPSPLPSKYRTLDLTQRLEVLRDRMGIWHEYAPLISALSRDGFPPSSIEEATGITGVEQNCLVVASQVRDSLLGESAAFPPDLLPYFDSLGGPDLLYELRFLNARQRADAAKHAIDYRLEPKGVRELARSMKDFPRRRGVDEGWEVFDGASPGDCLAFARFRQSREAIDVEDSIAELERALQVVVSETAKARVELELERARKKAAGEEVVQEEGDAAAPTRPAVNVVRLQYGEVAEASTVLLLPVVRETDGVAAMLSAPRRTKTDVDLGIVEVDKEWARWAVVPGWGPVAAAAEAVVIELADGRTLPWRTVQKEPVLVIANRRQKEVVEKGIYVLEKEGRLVVERGSKLAEKGIATADAEVVIVVRPPRDEDDMISSEEWD